MLKRTSFLSVASESPHEGGPNLLNAQNNIIIPVRLQQPNQNREEIENRITKHLVFEQLEQDKKQTELFLNKQNNRELRRLFHFSKDSKENEKDPEQLSPRAKRQKKIEEQQKEKHDKYKDKLKHMQELTEQYRKKRRIMCSAIEQRNITKQQKIQRFKVARILSENALQIDTQTNLERKQQIAEFNQTEERKNKIERIRNTGIHLEENQLRAQEIKEKDEQKKIDFIAKRMEKGMAATQEVLNHIKNELDERKKTRSEQRKRYFENIQKIESQQNMFKSQVLDRQEKKLTQHKQIKHEQQETHKLEIFELSQLKYEDIKFNRSLLQKEMNDLIEKQIQVRKRKEEELRQIKEEFNSSLTDKFSRTIQNKIYQEQLFVQSEQVTKMLFNPEIYETYMKEKIKQMTEKQQIIPKIKPLKIDEDDDPYTTQRQQEKFRIQIAKQGENLARKLLTPEAVTKLVTPPAQYSLKDVKKIKT